MRATLTAMGIGLVVALTAPTAAEAAITISGPATTPETGMATYTVTRSAPGLLAGEASVTVTTSNGTAAAPGDYAAKSSMVTFPADPLGLADQTDDSFKVTVALDALDEADETFTVTLSSPTNETLGTGNTAVTTAITDDDAPPAVSIGPASVAEGTSATATTLLVPVTLSAPSGRTVTARAVTTAGTATSGTDFVPVDAPVTIPPGATAVSVAIPVAADAVDEGDETLTVTLSEPGQATLGATTTAIGTITDDDTSTIAVTGATVAEGAAGATTATTAAVTLSTPSAQPVIVTYATTDGSAMAPGDYTAATGQVTIPAGQRTVPVPLAIVGDATVEGDEVFGVTISAPSGAAIASGQSIAPVIIRNDDGAATGGGTTTTTGIGTSTGLPGAPPVARIGVTIKRLAYNRSTGTMRYRVGCPAGVTRCKVSVTVFTVAARKSKVKALRVERQLATKTLRLTAGTTAVVSLRLSARARGWVRAARTVKTIAYAVGQDATGAFSTAKVAGTLSR